MRLHSRQSSYSSHVSAFVSAYLPFHDPYDLLRSVTTLHAQSRHTVRLGLLILVVASAGSLASTVYPFLEVAIFVLSVCLILLLNALPDSILERAPGRQLLHGDSITPHPSVREPLLTNTTSGPYSTAGADSNASPSLQGLQKDAVFA